MPLVQSGSKKALGENIGIEEAAGKPPKQAAAIAYATQRANDNGIQEYCGDHLVTIPNSVPVHASMEQSKVYGDSK
jgi:hypothetical protein